MIAHQVTKDPRDLMNHAILNHFSILHSDGKSQLRQTSSMNQRLALDMQIILKISCS
jgi:hypothetical protein